MGRSEAVRAFAAALLCAALCSARPGFAADVAWRGGTGWWDQAANWSGDTVPAAGDNVSITSGAVVLTNSTPWLGTVVISNASLIFTNWGTSLSAETVNVLTGGVLRISNLFTNDLMSNNLTVWCGSFCLGIGGLVDGDGKGWGGLSNSPGYGPGGGGRVDNEAGGGGHGGRGGSYSGAPRGATNDSLTAPVFPGSAGGSSLKYQSPPQPGGAGGGAIRIAATGTVSIAGIITANGSYGPGRCGGGSGGAIFITARDLYGAATAVVRANGGNGGGQSGGASGGGGGGRIAIWRSGGDFAGSVTADRAPAGGDPLGEPGTVYWGILPRPQVAPSNSFGRGASIRTLAPVGGETNLLLALCDSGPSTNAMQWALLATNDFLFPSATNGLLPTGTVQIVQITNSASGKSPGVYTGEVVFSAMHSGMIDVPPVLLPVQIVMTVTDALPPVIASIVSSTPDGSYSAGETINVTVNFSGPVSLSSGALKVLLDTGREVSIGPFAPSLSASGSYVVQAGDSTPDLDAVGVSTTGPVTNAAGRGLWVELPAVTIADVRNIVLGRPTVVLDTTASEPTDLQDIPVTAVFSVPVYGFSASDLVVSNAVVTNFGGSGADYSFILKPQGRGVVRVDVPENAAVDASGNGNVSNSLSRTFAYRLDVTVLPPGRGAVSGTDLWYNLNVSLSPVPSEGCFFRQWSGPGLPEGQCLASPLNLVMDRPRTILAVFGTNTAPTTRTWSGSGSWFTLANWTPMDFPYEGDDAVIAGGVCVVSEPLQVYRLTVTNATLLFTNWNSTLKVGNLMAVRTGGVVTAAGPFTEQMPSNNISIECGSLAVDAGGAIQADGKGYRGGYSWYDASVSLWITNDAAGRGPGSGPPGPQTYPKFDSYAT